MTDRCSSSRGFTLLEVIVALVIVGLFVSILLPATLSTLDRQEDVALRARALILAKTKIAEYQLIATSAESSAEGDESGLHWTAEVKRVSRERPRRGMPQKVVLRRVEVVVRHGQDALVTLDVLSVGRP